MIPISIGRIKRFYGQEVMNKLMIKTQLGTASQEYFENCEEWLIGTDVLEELPRY